VLEIAEGLNYRPRGAGSKRTEHTVSPAQSVAAKTIGFEYFSYALSDTLTTNGFYSVVLAGAQAEAADLGMHMLISTTHRHKPSAELPPMVRDSAVAGMLLVGTADPEILESFVRYVPHIVLLDNRDVNGLHDSVFSDGFSGSYEATRHLLNLGHRQIGFMTSRATEVTLRDRFNGFICAHYHAGVPINAANLLAFGKLEDIANDFLNDNELRTRLVDEVVEFLRRPHRPTAFVASNDDQALMLMRACGILNISIPHDLSIVGFDDIRAASATDPPLTTVHVDMMQLGRLAVRRLHGRIIAAQDGKKSDPAVFEQAPVKLIIRQSTAPVRR
jgi:LacI family transcriptional regulator